MESVGEAGKEVKRNEVGADNAHEKRKGGVEPEGARAVLTRTDQPTRQKWGKKGYNETKES